MTTLVRIAEDETVRIRQAIRDGKRIYSLNSVLFLWKFLIILAKKVEKLESKT